MLHVQQWPVIPAIVVYTKIPPKKIQARIEVFAATISYADNFK